MRKARGRTVRDGVVPSYVKCEIRESGEGIMGSVLEGLRVLDASTIIAGPLAAGLLGDFGAEVIKVEDPQRGDPIRAYARTANGVPLYHKVTNRNKQSITLDLHQPPAQDLFKRLAQQCDVVIVNFRPATLARWHIDYEDLQTEHPGLVMLHLSAFGRTGPYRDRPGFARIAEAFAGLTAITGYPDGPPLFSGFPLADGITGMYGAYAVLLALQYRQQTGNGQLIDLGLYEPILRMLEDLPAVYNTMSVVRGRQGNQNPGVAPNDVYPARDGQWVVLPISTQRMFERLAAAMGQPELVADPRFQDNARRVANRSVLDQKVREFFQTRDAAEMVRYLDRFGVAAGMVNSIAEVIRDPHIQARGNLVSLPDEESGERIMMPNVVPHLTQSPGQVRFVGEALGASNERIYGGLLGLSHEQLAELRRGGVI